jgi:NAD(P)-dependent dehydrogenase (short-subunit alcohol dehydrogenase family)
MDSPQPSPLDYFDLSGRTAVVTGGSRGLGKEMVQAFAAQGANVVIASRKLENCEVLAAEVEERFGVRALPVECHIGYWEQAEALAERAISEFGRIDILVNNAGMSPLYPSLDAIDEALYDKVMEVNLKGTFRLSVLMAEHMRASGRGSIISVSSTAAVKPTPGEVVYGLAKAGLHNMTESFSKAYGPEVRVNCIQPGPFLTDISKAWSDEALDHIGKGISLGRAGEPHEVIGAALYFASDASSFTTGAVLRMDGGLG